MASLFDIGVSSLRTQQAALAVTGQNISNAATPGYSRQRVEITSLTAGTEGSVFQGAGAQLDRITRIANEFTTSQIRLDTAMFSELEALNGLIGQVEGLLADRSSGLDPALQAFFGALQAASNQPNSLPTRQLVISQAQGMVDRFHSLQERLDGMFQNIDNILRSSATSANELAQGIADLNDRIAHANNNNRNGAVNSLLDQRDELLRELSGLVAVRTTVQQDGQINVFIGKGQPLVLASDASRLGVTEAGAINITPVTGGGQAQDISQSLDGGEIGGVLAFRDQVLTPSLNQLGQLALTLAESFNALHTQGVDLNGAFGENFFTDINNTFAEKSRVVGFEANRSQNPGAMRVTIDDLANIENSAYEFVFTESGQNSYFIRRVADNEIVGQGTLGVEFPKTVSFDSLTLTIEQGTFEAGDRYTIDATRNGARDLAIQISRPENLALSGPVRAINNIGNVGSGELIIGEILDRNHPLFAGLSAGGNALAPPLLVKFTSSTTYDILDNSDPANPQQLNPPLTGLQFVPGVRNDVLPSGLDQLIVASTGGNAGAISVAPSAVLGLQLVNNAYGNETISITGIDPLTGAQSLLQQSSFLAGTSARAIADQLSALSGIQASATTTVKITGITDDAAGTKMVVAINGERIAVANPITLNGLADAISQNEALKAAGIVAASDGQTLILTALNGEDINLHVTGDAADTITLASSGQTAVLAGVGPGTTAFVTGSVDRSAGFDFSNGGPYVLSLAINGNATSDITLSTNYPSGASLVNGLQAEIDAAFGVGEVVVSIDGSGLVSFTTVATGEDAQLSLQNASAGSAIATALGMTSQTNTGVDSYETATINGQVSVILAAGLELTSNASAIGNIFVTEPVHSRADFGFRAFIEGRPEVGDRFEIGFNRDGTSDNRNGLNLINLRTSALVGSPPVTYAESYGELVELVGVRASQTRINREAASALLEQSISQRESLSGVNLDEEAANLIKFEQAYNASAQIISVARDIFNILFNILA